MKLVMFVELNKDLSSKKRCLAKKKSVKNQIIEAFPWNSFFVDRKLIRFCSSEFWLLWRFFSKITAFLLENFRFDGKGRSERKRNFQRAHGTENFINIWNDKAYLHKLRTFFWGCVWSNMVGKYIKKTLCYFWSFLRKYKDRLICVS